mmetsp:Transcript_460/g.611  ORF Transcript_460/g.611 Transcript_460/m.611 type:complete len:244 (-) Transcript_460:116-847(-)
MTGQSLQSGESSDSCHGPTSMRNLQLTHCLATVGGVSEQTVKVQGIKIVVTGHSVLPYIGHVLGVLLSNLCVINTTERSLVFKVSEPSKDGSYSNKGKRVKSVEDRGCNMVGSVKHKVGPDKLSEGPSDNRKHRQSCVSDLCLHHCVHIEVLRKPKWVESDISSVGSVEVGRALQKWNRDRHLPAKVPSSLHTLLRVNDRGINFLHLELRFSVDDSIIFHTIFIEDFAFGGLRSAGCGRKCRA